MEFESFEQALQVCVTAEEKSPEQVAAMEYCLQNAPADLRDMLLKRVPVDSDHDCGCGCGGDTK